MLFNFVFYKQDQWTHSQHNPSSIGGSSLVNEEDDEDKSQVQLILLMYAAQFGTRNWHYIIEFYYFREGVLLEVVL